MAHFAEIDNDNNVLRVLVIENEHERNGQVYLADDLGLGGTWIQTSYNTHGGVHDSGAIPLRKNYAGVGFKYDSELDAFIPPKPHESWILDEQTCLWNPPVEYPLDGNIYLWDEDLTNWKLLDIEQGE
jgi:hypothetical protein